MEIELFGLTQDHDMIGLLLDFKYAREGASATFYGSTVNLEGPPLRTVLLECKHLKPFLLYWEVWKENELDQLHLDCLYDLEVRPIE